VNEGEITPLLEERGFETVLCEDLSLAELVKLFAKTTALVGAHGAGLTNLIYCLPGSCVGEVSSGRVPPHTHTHYLVMSQQLGMHFSRFKAEVASRERNHVDIRIDKALFSTWISTYSDQLSRAKRRAT
jgi:capsular polysaccharide biosynthesis protein